MLNFVVMFFFVNLGLAIYYGVSARVSPESEHVPVLSKYSLETLKLAYPDLSDDVLRDLLLESWTRDHAYRPFT